MSGRILDIRPDGIIEKFHYDETTDTSYIETIQDVESIIKENKRQFNDTPEFGKHKGDLHRVASVPVVLMQKWAKEWGLNMYGEDFKVKLIQRLNDPDYKYLKTCNTKI